MTCSESCTQTLYHHHQQDIITINSNVKAASMTAASSCQSATTSRSQTIEGKNRLHMSEMFNGTHSYQETKIYQIELSPPKKDNRV